MIRFCAVFLGLISLASPHSWMSCPPSFNTAPNRGGDTIGPCEQRNGGQVTEVNAGDRLKVGWTSNNHAGGWVRLALVPYEQRKVHEHFEVNVLKVVCYGVDEHNRRSRYGDCVHPCNAREGCQYQANKYDVNRYDTTIKIPYNLPSSPVYVLQWMSAMGNHGWFYYSCALLRISGGNPSLSCEQTAPAPVAYGCQEGSAMKLEQYNNIKMGNFCFAEDGLGDQDADIRTVPVNPDCDARITCELSVNKPACLRADNKMKDIRGQRQICEGEVLPPPEHTCEDGVKNNGEDMVDCGGPECEECVEEPTEPIDGRIYRSMNYEDTVLFESGIMEVRMDLVVITEVNDWRFTIQLTGPVDFYSFWNCKLISVNEYQTIWTFGPEDWNKHVQVNQQISCGFNGKFDPLGETPMTVTKIFEEYIPPPSCEDGILNQDEESIDCGGANCKECPEFPTQAEEDRIYTNMVYTENIYGAVMQAQMNLKITKAATSWKFVINTATPVQITGNWGCTLIDSNEDNTIWTFGPVSWNANVWVGQTISLGITGAFEAKGDEREITRAKAFIGYGVTDA